MRSSIYREKVLSVLKDAHLLSITDIQKKIKGADFSTIFRNIEKLCEEGIVKKILINKDNVLYEIVGQKDKHDHFVCNDCGTVESLANAKISLSGKAIATDILVRGKCKDCVK